MKTLKTLILSSIFAVCGMTVNAANSNNLVYNSQEVDGLMVGQTVYKADGALLANYMKYNYKYDDQKRMIENEALKWNSEQNKWEKDICIHYTYQGKTLTTEYYKWNKKKGAYVIVPELTVTMDNPNM